MTKKKFLKLILGSVLIFSVGISFGKGWHYTQEQSSTVRQMMSSLAVNYYDKKLFNEDLIAKTFDAYLKVTDSNKEFFLQKEINSLKKQEKAMQNAILKGDLELPFNMFEVSYSKKMQRYRQNIALLSDIRNFNFATKQRIELDREKSAWFKHNLELDSYWKKRLTHEILTLMESDGKSAKQAALQIQKRYQRNINYLEQSKSIDIFSLFMNALSLSLDPHTNYFSPRAEENFAVQMRLSLTGIGATLTTDKDYVKVVSMVPGGPADKQGQLQAEDKIIAVAQDDKAFVDVVSMRLDDVVQLIRGKKDTKVRLKVLRNKESLEISIIRNVVKLEDQAASKRILQTSYQGKNHKVGIIKIPAFYSDFDAANRGEKDYRSTSRDVAKLVEELKKDKVDSILIDLRYNGGGSLQEVSDMIGLFIERGPSVQVRSANGRIDVLGSNAKHQIYQGALGVVINRFSASASEIFAAAMQDYGRAIILGDTSFGKGSVQNMQSLQLGQMKYTTAKFYRVSGASTQHKGVEPDIYLPTFVEHSEIGESALENAMPWDNIRSVVKNTSKEFVSNLKKMQSQLQDLKTTADYKYLKSNADFIKSHSNTDFSLNKKIRDVEDAKYKAKRLAIINAWRIAKGKQAYKDFKAWEDDIKRINKLLNKEKRGEPAFEYLNAIDQSELNLSKQIMAIYSSMVK